MIEAVPAEVQNNHWLSQMQCAIGHYPLLQYNAFVIDSYLSSLLIQSEQESLLFDKESFFNACVMMDRILNH